VQAFSRVRSAHANDWLCSLEQYLDERLSWNVLPHHLFGAVAPAFMAFACAFILGANLSRSDLGRNDVGGSDLDRAVAARPTPWAALRSDLALLDSHFFSGHRPGSFAGATALQEDDQPEEPASPRIADRIAQAFSLASLSGEQLALAEPSSDDAAPQSRSAAPAPSGPSPLRRAGSPASRVLANTPAHKPTIFERLFGKPASSQVALAYAAPDDGVLSDEGTPGRYDRWTAVYDISAHTVYLPDGTTLEAHSGLGSLRDNPHHTNQKNRGATPATVYDLQPREGLFHGVRALRLIPVDEDKVFGRSGFLAHTYMLGSFGESNGCVVFKNYDAFLQAYRNNLIKHLVVVGQLD